MSWYDIQQWKNTIQEHSRFNTSKGCIRELVRYCAVISERTLIANREKYTYYDGDERIGVNRERILMLVHCLTMFIQNPHYESHALYNTINTLLTDVHKDDTCRHLIDSASSMLNHWLTRSVPTWYARALRDGKMVQSDIDNYSHTHYDADIDSFKILRGTRVFDDYMVIIHTSFDNEDEYRELFRETFANERRTLDDIRTYINEVISDNIRHIGTEEWMMFASQMGYGTIEEFVLNSGIRAHTFVTSGVPLDELLHVIDIARTSYYDDDATLYMEDIEESGVDTTFADTGVVHGDTIFFNTREIARSLSQRPDITYDVYVNMLCTLPWWTDTPSMPYNRRHFCQIPTSPTGSVDATFISGILSESSYGHVFRDFMDNKNKWRDILNPANRWRNGSSDWKWFFSALSRNVHLKMDDIKELSEVDWDWEELSSNDSIATPDNILSNMSLPWVWGRWGISASRGITPEFVKEHWENGINFGDSPGNRYSDGGTLSGNISVVTPELIDYYPDKTWNYDYYNLSSNTNITMPWLLRNLTRGDWEISHIITLVKPDRELAVRAIQSWWRIVMAKRRCFWLASEVEEWWYNPDCKPAARMREDMLWRNHRTAFD